MGDDGSGRSKSTPGRIQSRSPRSQSELQRLLLHQQKSPQLLPLRGCARRLQVECPNHPRKHQPHLCPGQMLAHAAPWTNAKRLHSKSLIVSERGGRFHGLRQPAFREEGKGVVKVCWIAEECPGVYGYACLGQCGDIRLWKLGGSGGDGGNLHHSASTCRTRYRRPRELAVVA